MLPSGKRAKNARSISLPSLWQHYFDKLENKVQIHHRHIKCDKIAIISLVHPEIFDEIRRTTTWTRNPISIRLFSAKTTGSIFTKIIHDIVTLVALLNNAYTRRYPISFLNAMERRKCGVCHFLHKIGCHGNVPWDSLSKKEFQIDHLHPKCFY